MNRNHHDRSGFTLIELLVVISLMAVLATLAVAFIPTAASTARESRAGTIVQSTLTAAKQRAMRDQAPRGVRFLINANFLSGSTPVANVVTELQYLEQPDDFPGAAGVAAQSATPVPPPAPALGYTNLNCLFINTDLLNGYPTPIVVPGVGNVDPNMQFWAVQPGDYIEFLGTGLVHQIAQIGVPDQTNTVQPNFIVFTPPLVNPISPTMNFRIVRAPRVAGDDSVKLPDDTVIDLGTNATFGNAVPFGNYLDVLFAPSGEVISPRTGSSNIHLWVRMPSPGGPTDPFKGDPTIVSVFTKTGFVGAYPPSSGTPTTPYLLVR